MSSAYLSIYFSANPKLCTLSGALMVRQIHRSCSYWWLDCQQTGRCYNPLSWTGKSRWWWPWRHECVRIPSLSLQSKYCSSSRWWFGNNMSKPGLPGEGHCVVLDHKCRLGSKSSTYVTCFIGLTEIATKRTGSMRILMLDNEAYQKKTLESIEFADECN